MGATFRAGAHGKSSGCSERWGAGGDAGMGEMTMWETLPEKGTCNS